MPLQRPARVVSAVELPDPGDISYFQIDLHHIIMKYCLNRLYRPFNNVMVFIVVRQIRKPVHDMVAITGAGPDTFTELKITLFQPVSALFP